MLTLITLLALLCILVFIDSESDEHSSHFDL